jgi:hypothetical protein
MSSWRARLRPGRIFLQVTIAAVSVVPPSVILSLSKDQIRYRIQRGASYKKIGHPELVEGSDSLPEKPGKPRSKKSLEP